MGIFFWCYFGAVVLLIVFFIAACLIGSPRRVRKGIGADNYDWATGESGDWDGLHHREGEE